MLWLIVTTLGVVLAWFYLMKPFNFWRERGVPQTKPWPLLGDSWPLLFRLKSRNEHLEWLYNMFPDRRFFGCYSFKMPAILIRDPELLKKILVKDFDHFTDHANALLPEETLISKILFFLKGNIWKDVRSTLSGSFTSSKMKYMFGTVKAASEKFADHFDQQNRDVIEVEMKDTYARFTNDVIASVAFGIEIDSFRNPENDFYLAGINIFGGEGTRGLRQLLSFMRLVLPNSITKIIMRLVLSTGVATKPDVFFEKVINETIELREKNNIKRNDMINLLIEIKHGVTHVDEKVTVDTGYATVEESDIGKAVKKHGLVDIDNRFIAAQALVFFIAGFDTVSTAMSFGTYELAFHPEIQAKLRKEINETLVECKGDVTYDALLRMKYLDMVVSEILRKWHPTSGALDRVCIKPYTLEGENPGEKSVTLQTGQLVWLPYGAIQKDPKYWPEPDKFDPERFSDENKGNIVPYTYFPFGAGPRNCIGSRFALLEVKCMLFYILRKYEFLPTEKTQVPLKLAKNTFQNTAEDGFWLSMRKVTV